MKKQKNQHHPSDDAYLQDVNVAGMSTREAADEVLREIEHVQADGEHLVPFIISVHHVNDPDASWQWEVGLFFPRTGESVWLHTDHIRDAEDAHHKASIIGLLLFNLFDKRANSGTIADMLLAMDDK